MLILCIVLQLLVAGTQPANDYERLWRDGRKELAEAHYADAVRILRVAVREAEIAGADRTSLAVAMGDLAEALRRLGHIAEAEGLYKRSLELLRQEPASKRQLIMVLNNQGTLYREIGLYSRSEASFTESLAAAKQAHIKNDPLFAAVLNGMAAALSSQQGNLKEAEKYLKESLRIRESILGLQHLDVAETLNNLGVVHQLRKQYVNADAAFRRALAITENTLGSDHPDVAVTLNNMGTMYYAQKEYTEAERVFRRALEIRMAKLPPGHPILASSLYNLGQVMISLGNSLEAELLLKQAVAIRGENKRRTEPEDVIVLERYATALRLNGHEADANAIESKTKVMRAELKYIARP